MAVPPWPSRRPPAWGSHRQHAADADEPEQVGQGPSWDPGRGFHVPATLSPPTRGALGSHTVTLSRSSQWPQVVSPGFT